MKAPRQRPQDVIRNATSACAAGGVVGLLLFAGCNVILGVRTIVAAPDASSDDGSAPGADATSGADSQSDATDAGQAGDSSSIEDASNDATDVAIGPDSEAGTDSSSLDGAGPSDGSADVADSPVETATDANESGTGDAGLCASRDCRRVFVTATQMGAGNIGGVGGADGICQGAANLQGLNGTWKAWLSDLASAPSNRFIRATVPYRLLDGTVVANDWVGLTSGSLRHAIDLDERKIAIAANPFEVWTGTLATGDPASGTCSDWTSVSASYVGIVGLTNASDGRWSNAYSQFCNRSNIHLYCFEQ